MESRLTYRERLDELRKGKLRQTREKQKLKGPMDMDDQGQVVPPLDQVELVEVVAGSGVKVRDFVLKGFEAATDHPSGGIFGPKACGENFERLLDLHPTYLHPLNSMAGVYRVYFITHRNPAWNPDFDFSHLQARFDRYPKASVRRGPSTVTNRDLHVVTGAFGYSGKYIASRLLQDGVAVKTLTDSPNRENPFGGAMEAVPFYFEDPAALERSEEAVRNTTILFHAAARAGVERIVHVSVSNPSSDSDLEYFRGKGIVEERLAATGVSYAILRPTVLFGKEDILINNIAWLLRKSPIFGVFGDGRYRLQPVYVGDLAELAVRAGRERRNEIIEAIGPETFTYRELVDLIGRKIGARRPVIAIPPGLGVIVGRILGFFLRDLVITGPEIEGLMRGLLYVDARPAGTTPFSAWLDGNAKSLGLRYASELARRLTGRARPSPGPPGSART